MGSTGQDGTQMRMGCLDQNMGGSGDAWHTGFHSFRFGMVWFVVCVRQIVHGVAIVVVPMVVPPIVVPRHMLDFW